MMRLQGGDTLVEVALSIAILSVTLAAAYNIANSTYNLGIEARERTEANGLVQQQAERLRAYRDRLQAGGGTFINNANFPNNPAYMIDANLNRQDCTPALCTVGLYTFGINSQRHSSDLIFADIFADWTRPGGGGNNRSHVSLTLVDRSLNKINCELVEGCASGP